jgi:hypothetical protein
MWMNGLFPELSLNMIAWHFKRAVVVTGYLLCGSYEKAFSNSATSKS